MWSEKPIHTQHISTTTNCYNYCYNLSLHI